MLHFRGGEGDELLGRQRLIGMHADADQEGIRQQHEGDVAVPAQVAADLVLIESQVFAHLQVLFNVPPGPNGAHHDGQGRVRWSPDQVVSQLVRVVEATTKDEPMAPIHPALMQQRQAGPIKATLAFGALAGTEPLPVLGSERLLRDAGHIGQQDPGARLHTHDFGRGDG